jgi:hypothetical protein
MASTGAVAAVGAGILTERAATPALAAGQTADYFDANASASNAFTTIGYGYTFGVNVIGTSIGVKGTCADSTNNPNDEVGVYGVTRGGEGVRAEATGTDSLGNPGTGVTGSSAAGYGGVFTGGRAPILLNPSFSTGAPTTGIHFIGEVYVDGNGVFWVCAADGTPGTWNALSSVVPIPNVRVLNTRPGKQIGPYTGPIANNTVLTLTLAGTNGIPSNATGVMGNLTAADASAGCFLALVPSGANHMGVSSVNFPALPLGSGVANSFTVGLAGTPGTVDIYTGNCSTYTVNIIMDITGYII